MLQLIENFRFMVIEAENQVKLTYGLVSDFQQTVLEKIVTKDDYIDNLKATIEDACFFDFNRFTAPHDKPKANDMRAIHVICVNLERIADFCVNIGRQLTYLSSVEFFRQYTYQPMFAEMQRGLSQITGVFDRRDLAGALDICRIEFTLDRMYKENFDRILSEFKEAEKAPDLVTSLFVFRYLERIGDSLLNIGEALIFAILGDRIKIRQIDALEKTLTESGFKGGLADVDFAAIWGSRSGCRIGKVGDKNPSGFNAQGIFKEGITRKIKREKENIFRWNELFPGIAPRVFGYYEKTKTASMLVEFLSGCTLDQVVLTEQSEMIRNVFFIFEQTVLQVWRTTLQPGPVTTDYMEQLTTRLDAVFRVHSHLRRGLSGIGGFRIASTTELIETCIRVERAIPAPASVFIHGDFNTNNIVYDHANQRVHYIDLYRSRQADYVQDASVFLISHFRLPVFDKDMRERLNTVSLYFYEFFAEFAEEIGDRTFPPRMALALIRSFYTSTRFELKYQFAREMYLKAHFLMEKIAAHERDGLPWEDFQLPLHVLFH